MTKDRRKETKLFQLYKLHYGNHQELWIVRDLEREGCVPLKDTTIHTFLTYTEAAIRHENPQI